MNTWRADAAATFRVLDVNRDGDASPRSLLPLACSFSRSCFLPCSLGSLLASSLAGCFPLDVWLASAGVLSLDELRQGLADIGITDEQIDQLHTDLDTDQDGKVLLK